MENMSKYIRLSRSLNDKGLLIKPEELSKYVDDTKDYYTSVYYYNDEHLKKFQETGSIKGITDVVTDKLVFDFDSKDDIELARRDSIELVDRLENFGVDKKDIEIYFSGQKGFTINATLDREVSPDKLAYIATQKLGRGLETLDLSVYNASRILRVPNTKHQESGLYKVPLSYTQLKKLSIQYIKKYAEVPKPQIKIETGSIVLPEEIFREEVIEKKQPVERSQLADSFDVSRRPNHWKDYKWALLQGRFEKGERHNAMMVIAATCRGLGYDVDTTKAMCLSADEKHIQLTQDTPIEDLETNVLPSIFSEHWNGGQYSYKSNPWLRKYCEKMGFKVTEESEELTIEIDKAYTLFKDYATNIDKLTIKTGIQELDEQLRMTVGMSVGIVAPPGVGKTSVALQMLNSMSKAGEQSVFFSYDMFHALVFQKLVQKHFKIDPDLIFKKFKSGDKHFQNEVVSKLKEEYRNVEFCFKPGQNIADIIETIKHTEQKTGKKVKFIVVDYNELVMSEYSDPTASSAFVAQKLREIANVHQICVVVLLQPSKAGGNPSDDIKSYRSAKGSSAIEQSLSIMLGMSRPGYNPRHPEDDNFISINCLKNRMGKLFSLDLHWDGLTGCVRSLSEEEYEQLEMVRKRKAEEENGKSEGWN